MCCLGHSLCSSSRTCCRASRDRVADEGSRKTHGLDFLTGCSKMMLLNDAQPQDKIAPLVAIGAFAPRRHSATRVSGRLEDAMPRGVFTRTPIPLAKRFWKKVQKGPGCWTWTGSNIRGYGRLMDDDKKVKMATHIAWSMKHGPAPKGIFVCHHCDNPACVKTEPDAKYPSGHLFLGTHADNMRDASKKQRFNKSRPWIWGELSAKSKLTDEQVAHAFTSPRTGQSIAEEYGVEKSAIYSIRNGMTWRHITKNLPVRTEIQNHRANSKGRRK